MRLWVVVLQDNVFSISALMALTTSSRRCSSLDVKPPVKTRCNTKSAATKRRVFSTSCSARLQNSSMSSSERTRNLYFKANTAFFAVSNASQAEDRRERSTLAVWLRRDANAVDLGRMDGKSRRVGMCKTWTMRCFLLISIV